MTWRGKVTKTPCFPWSMTLSRNDRGWKEIRREKEDKKQSGRINGGQTWQNGHFDIQHVNWGRFQSISSGTPAHFAKSPISQPGNRKSNRRTHPQLTSDCLVWLTDWHVWLALLLIGGYELSAKWPSASLQVKNVLLYWRRTLTLQRANMKAQHGGIVTPPTTSFPF